MGKKTASLSDNFTLAVYMQFLVAADIYWLCLTSRSTFIRGSALNLLNHPNK